MLKNKFAAVLVTIVSLLSISPVGVMVGTSYAAIDKTTGNDTTIAASGDDVKSSLSEGINKTGTPTASDPDALIKNVINLFSVIVGIVAVIMVIIGGFRYITSGGEAAAVTSAKNTILYAVVGLIIVAFAQVIVIFVLNKATGK